MATLPGVVRYATALLLAGSGVAGCTGRAQVPDWVLAPVPAVGVLADSGRGQRLPLSLRSGELEFIAYATPSSRVMVLRDGMPGRMRASVISFVPVPPQGRDSFQTMSRRVLLVWTADEMSEGLAAGGTHFPASVVPLPNHCCSPDQMRAGRWNAFSVLDVQFEQEWHAINGSVSISPPRLTGPCSGAVERAFSAASGDTSWCQEAEFDVSLDVSYRQNNIAPEAPGAVRTRGIAPVRVRGIQLRIDCARRTEAFEPLCGPYLSP